jgi:hypothetical protein
MARHGLFTKDVYIRLEEGGTGFLYTVKYGRLSLPPRRTRVVENGRDPLRTETRAIETPDRMPVRRAPGSAGSGIGTS